MPVMQVLRVILQWSQKKNVKVRESFHLFREYINNQRMLVEIWVLKAIWVISHTEMQACYWTLEERKSLI
jgi:hypothetical protein